MTLRGLVFCLCCALWPATAPAQQIVEAFRTEFASDPATAERNLRNALDVLQSGSLAALRQQEVAGVFDAWRKADRQPRLEVSLATVLCRIAPFTLPDPTATEAARTRLGDAFSRHWQRYLEDGSEDALLAARFHDCAAQNIVPGYFSASARLDRVVPFEQCATRNYSPADTLEEIGADFDAVVQKSPALSYYRLRGTHFSSLLTVARALADQRGGTTAWPRAQSDFAKASAAYLALVDGPDFLRMRNGWRHVNEFRLHGTAYGLVAHPEGTTERTRLLALLDEMAGDAPVLDQDRTARMIAPSVRQRIARERPDYIDPVSIDRLFPGLLHLPEQDCARNRRQSLEVQDLAAGTLMCLALSDPAKGLAELRAFDTCLSNVESKVWWLQMGAYRNAARAQKAAQELQQAYGGVAGKTQVDFTVIRPDTTSEFFRIRTGTPLTRSEVGLLADRARADKRSVLIGRAPVF